ncbi:MAG: helix-turn-helix transcriptional regulator, partial [Pirellulales bacterium]
MRSTVNGSLVQLLDDERSKAAGGFAPLSGAAFADDMGFLDRDRELHAVIGGEPGSTRSSSSSSDDDEQPLGADGLLSIEDLARRFNVSTKTISRWRCHGLVPETREIGGRRRVGFLPTTVERFVASNPLRVERGSRFSQLTPDEHDRIIAWARRLATLGACPADIHRRIARRLNRSVETIRYTIKQYDQEHPGAEVFPAVGGNLRPETCERIHQLHARGESVDSIARRYRRSRASIYRVISAQRA